MKEIQVGTRLRANFTIMIGEKEAAVEKIQMMECAFVVSKDGDIMWIPIEHIQQTNILDEEGI